MPTATTGTSTPALERMPFWAKCSFTMRDTGRKQPAGMPAGGWGSHQLS